MLQWLPQVNDLLMFYYEKMHDEDIKITEQSKLSSKGNEKYHKMRQLTFLWSCTSSLPFLSCPRCGVPLPTHHWSLHADLPGGSAGLQKYRCCHRQPAAAAGGLWERPSPVWCWLAPRPDCQVSWRQQYPYFLPCKISKFVLVPEQNCDRIKTF